MRVAVTGASGFCGGHVAGRLAAEGHSVITLGRRPGPVGEHRFWDAAGARPDLRGAEAVVHLAAEVGDAPPGRRTARFATVNVGGTRRLLAAARGLPVVVVGSASAYDPRPDRSSVTESHPVASGQLNDYGRTKAAAETFALAAGAVVLRPRAVYGPGEATLLPRLRRTLLPRLSPRAGRTLLLPGPDVVLSLTHVANLATACRDAIGWPPGAYNIADPQPYRRDRALGAVFTAITGEPVRVHHLPLALARAAVRAAATTTRLGREPLLTAYSLDLLSATCVLDVSKALRTGWSPRLDLTDLITGLTPP